MAQHHQVKSRKTIAALTVEVGNWAVSNFDYLDTVGYGMLKELGKWARFELRFRQKFPSEKKNLYHGAELQISLENNRRKSIADCMIFLLNWCFIKDVVISLEEADDYIHNNRTKQPLTAIGLSMAALSQIFIMHETNFGDDPILRRPYAQRIFNNLALMCSLNAWDFKKVLYSKWDQVSKLNWRLYPKNGVNE